MEEYQEGQYLHLLKRILESGKLHENRTGVSTRRLLCEVMRFNLQEEFPLLTTKKVYWKGVVHELLWFLSGSTNIQYLKDNGVNFWNANSEDYCKRIGKAEDDGDVGRIYGCQWTDWHTRNHEGMNINQIKNAIDQIKNNPSSRRIVVSAWNPTDMKSMALPPCHIMFQFTVDDGLLHCTMYQRSGDLALGCPLNIASYALLTCMVAHVCDLKQGTFCHVINDCHLYENHIDAVKEQLTRTPYPFPTIKLNPDVKDIFDFKYEDIELINYKCHASIKMEMAL